MWPHAMNNLSNWLNVYDTIRFISAVIYYGFNFMFSSSDISDNDRGSWEGTKPRWGFRRKV